MATTYTMKANGGIGFLALLNFKFHSTHTQRPQKKNKKVLSTKAIWLKKIERLDDY